MANKHPRLYFTFTSCCIFFMKVGFLAYIRALMCYMRQCSTYVFVYLSTYLTSKLIIDFLLLVYICNLIVILFAFEK